MYYAVPIQILSLTWTPSVSRTLHDLRFIFFFQYVYILLRATFYEVNYVYCDILYLYRHSNAASATDNQIDGLQCARYVYNIIYYVYKI